jgi:hypothetical protein
MVKGMAAMPEMTGPSRAVSAVPVRRSARGLVDGVDPSAGRFRCGLRGHRYKAFDRRDTNPWHRLASPERMDKTNQISSPDDGNGYRIPVTVP